MNDFQEILDQHISELTAIQTQINELLEFQRQWDELFRLGKDLMGHSVKITIQGRLLYYTYTYDKYSILVSDLYSLLNGQITYTDSLTNKLLGNIKLRSRESINSSAQRINIDFGSNVPAEDYEFLTKQFQERHYNHLVEAEKEHLKNVFPNIADNYVLTKGDVDSYKEKIKAFKDELKPHRHTLNHRYEKQIVARNRSRQDLSLERINEIFSEYREKINLISVIYSQTSHDFNVPYEYENEMQSVIDNIIFGGVKGFMFKTEISNKNLADNDGKTPENPKFYNQFREQYFKSKKFAKLLKADI